MLFKLSNLNSNLALTLGYLNPALNNSAQVNSFLTKKIVILKVVSISAGVLNYVYWRTAYLHYRLALNDKFLERNRLI